MNNQKKDLPVYDKEQKVTCEKCGKTYTKYRMTFGGFWIGECKCVTDERKRLEKLEAERKKRENLERRIESSGIPKRYLSSTFETFQTKPETQNALAAATLYAKKFMEFADGGQGLIFTGNTGSGKTRLATAIGNELLIDGYTVKFTSFNSLIDHINYGDDYGKTEAETIKKYQMCRLLILDDICVTNVSDRWKRVLYSIVDYRVNELKPTIYTTNITSLDEIKTKLNEQIFDRITGSCAEIKLTASSYRQIKNF